MGIEVVKSRIEEIVHKYAGVHVEETNTPLTIRPYALDAIGLTRVLLDIEDTFSVDLNKLHEEALDYSIDSLSKAVHKHML